MLLVTILVSLGSPRHERNCGHRRINVINLIVMTNELPEDCLPGPSESHPCKLDFR